MFYRHVIKNAIGEYFIRRNHWTTDQGQATLFNSVAEAQAHLSGSSDNDLARGPMIETWLLSPRAVKTVEPCTHPDHVDGQSCEDRAVGCRRDCPCCCPPEKQLGYQRREDYMYFCIPKSLGAAEITVVGLELEYTDEPTVFTDFFAMWQHLVKTGISRVCVVGPDAEREGQFEEVFAHLGFTILQMAPDGEVIDEAE